ncbi:transposase [Methylobacterium sp. A52T]
MHRPAHRPGRAGPCRATAARDRYRRRAWRRGHHYGTVIVDLKRWVIADLLPDRETEAVAGWLRRHPRVEIVARDRAEVYGEAVWLEAPEAVHVLDRWHLLRNLGEALQEAVGSEHAVIRSVARTLGDERAAAHRTEQNHARPATAVYRRRLARHAPGRARHAEVLQLHGAGASVSGIARHHDLDR